MESKAMMYNALFIIVVAAMLAAPRGASAQGPTSQPAAATTKPITPAAKPSTPPVAAKPSAPAEPVAPKAPPPAPAAKSWLKGFEAIGFIDAYYSVNFNFPKPDQNTAIRAFDTTNGFALHWAALELYHLPSPVGGAISVRLGPGAIRWDGRDAAAGFGLEYLAQAFISWKPHSRVQLDFGKFGTLYGAEVADSQLNFNYTRGALNWLGQPYFHTGLRAAFTLSEHLTLSVLAVNGWNNSIDNNTMKSFGAQLSLTLGSFGIKLGYLMGPEGDELDAAGAEVDGANTRLRHFADLIVSAEFGRLKFLLNGDLGLEDMGPENALWYGVSAGLNYDLSQLFALAYRFEFVGDPDGWATGVTDLKIITNTVTFGIALGKHLLIRAEGRVDYANQELFQKGIATQKKLQATATLGVVVRTE